MVERRNTIGKLNSNWDNAFQGSFETEEDVIEFIFEHLDTSDFDDSYIFVGSHSYDANETFKVTAEDKKNLLYEYMMELITR